uniref:Piwi domain-containing protein n=1 Tax=Meloidogyne incognita TaxID=6306 RepID=A0A914KTD7_MELIC
MSSSSNLRASNVSTDNISSKPGLSSIFLIDVDQGKKAYRYDVEIMASDNPNKGWSLTKGSVDLNRRISSELVGIYVKKNSLLSPPNAYVYDGRSIFYSSAELQKSDAVSISYSEVSKLIQQTFDRKTKFNVILKPCQTDNRVLDLSDLSQYEGNTSLIQEDRSLRTFLELAIAQKTLESDKFISLGSGRLFKRIPDGCPYFRANHITFHSGICKGVRIVKGNNNGKVQAAVVLDAKVSAFLTSQTVEKTINDFMRYCNNQSDSMEKLFNFLRGVKVQCAYNRSRIFSIGGFGDKPLCEEKFERTIDGEICLVSLIDYFNDTKNIRLNNLQFPGVHPAGKPNEKFPVEQLIILEGQKIPQEKQSPDLVDILLRRNSIAPSERHQNIRQSGFELDLWNGKNNVLSAFSIKVQSESNDTNIDVRPLPHLLYRNNREVAPSDDKGDWTRNSGNFLVPASFPQEWLVLFDSRYRELIDDFIKRLREKCFEKGMNFGNARMFPVAQNLFDSKTAMPIANEWRNAFGHCAQEKIPFILMIDSKVNDSHGLLKLFEVYRRSKSTKLITQQITTETVENILVKGHRQTLENIVNKLNVKFGGLNYQPILAQPQLPGLKKFEQRFDLSSGNILVIGYDVSHPTYKLHEPKKPRLNEPDLEMKMEEDEFTLTSVEPSVVGICANMAENPHSFIGDYFYQTSRKEAVDLTDLKQRSRWILASLEHNRPKQKLPQYVFILRDGLSEGQYEMAYRSELTAIKSGFELHNPKYMPKFVLVIGSKRHFKKFFAVGNDVDKAENMPPGSIIQEKVVRPDVFEFYLQSHFPIKGTGKPVEYAVLTNEINFNCTVEELKEYAKLLRYKSARQDHLEELMFKRSLYSFLMALSFNHQIVSRPISLPEPVFQADELAKRGHANYLALKRFFPNEVPYTNEQHCGHRLADNAQLTRVLSYWGDGQLILKNRFNA